MDDYYEKINKILENQRKPINLFDYILGNSYDNLQYKSKNTYQGKFPITNLNEEEYKKNFIEGIRGVV